MYLSSRRIGQIAPHLETDADAVAERLRSAGFTVERVVSLRELLEPIVVGRVKEVVQHPNADRLHICSVDDGSDEPLQVVTGADNVREGGSYPMIRSGTLLPNGRKIKRGKLRGEISEGMLGSADELALGEDGAGLLELAGSPEPGTPLTDVFDVDGFVIQLSGKLEEDDVAAALVRTAPPPEIQIDVFADVACPWCYIGESRLTAALAERPDLKVVWRWRPFQLQPELPRGGVPWPEFVAARFGGEEQASAMFDQVRETAADAGLDLRFDRITHAPNTADAHRLILHAADHDLARETAEALFHAYFTTGANVSDPSVLIGVAAEVGLEVEGVRVLLASEDALDAVAASQDDARRLGISGVPFYIFNGRTALSGAQPKETFGRALEMALEESA